MLLLYSPLLLESGLLAPCLLNSELCRFDLKSLLALAGHHESIKQLLKLLDSLEGSISFAGMLLFRAAFQELPCQLGVEPLL